jgi:uncharacterized damage-inducible protein DinB
MIERRFVIVAAAALCLGCTSKVPNAPTVAQVYDNQVTTVERDVVPLAEAMPADKYDFAPTDGEFKGVRTFAQQVKHLATVIYMVSAAAQKEKPPVDVSSENGPDSVAGKDQIVAYLKGALTYAHKAALALNERNQLELVKSPFGNSQVTRASVVGIVAWHSMDHYGQMVVYARMNGVVPPASR